MGWLYLAISDGTNEIVIADGNGGATDYRLIYGQWSPSIASLRTSPLAGRGPYNEVVERLTLSVHGGDAAEAYDNLLALQQIVDQVNRWARGENVAAVKLLYSAPEAEISSASEPLSATLLSADLELPADFNAGRADILGVKLTLTRLGLWLHTEEEAVAAEADDGDVLENDFISEVDLPAVCRLSLSNVIMTKDQPLYLITTDSADDIEIIDPAAVLEAGGAWSVVNDSLHLARNTTVVRYEPANTQAHLMPVTAKMSATNAGRVNGWLACVRNNSSTNTFRLRVAASLDGPALTYTRTVTVPVLLDDGNQPNLPVWIFLGVTSHPKPPTNVDLWVQSAEVGGSLDIDAIVRVNLSNPCSNVVRIEPGEGYSTSPAPVLRVDHYLLDRVSPEIRLNDTGNISTVYTAYSGDLVLTARGASLYTLLLATGGLGDYKSNYWRMTTVDDELYHHEMKAWRRPGYLTPV